MGMGRKQDNLVVNFVGLDLQLVLWFPLSGGYFLTYFPLGVGVSFPPVVAV